MGRKEGGKLWLRPILSFFLFYVAVVVDPEKGSSGSGKSAPPEADHRQGAATVGDFQAIVIPVVTIFCSAVLATIIAIAVTRILNNPPQVMEETLMTLVCYALQTHARAICVCC